MCYHLTIASPLTLSEVRSMLPAGLSADPLPSSELASFRALLPNALTAARMRVGACSCDLVRARLSDPREDERYLRSRYRSFGLPRDRIIRELERHRRRGDAVEPPAGWRTALAEFVAEHARNAGPTVFRLSFHPSADYAPSAADAGSQPLPAPPAEGAVHPLTRTVADIRGGPERWLVEGPPIMVLRRPA